MKHRHIVHCGRPTPPAVLLLFLFAFVGSGCAAKWPSDVERTLIAAGNNRSELERVLEHYRQDGDPQKQQAAEFLVGNMEGHGYTVAALNDADRNEIEYDALDYASFSEALLAIEALEDEHGEVDFKRKSFDEDAEVITADFLIDNIDRAFQAWREKPWAENLTFDAFCQYVLPYRGSNEPLNYWRGPCLQRYADLPEQLESPQDSLAAAKFIQRDVHKWVRFSDLYYLHPTDQGFEEMDERGVGRCEDISNMIGYALRANAIPCASDYTPFWADRDNNHAWEVILDENGQGKAGLSNRAAKIYRKTFAVQRRNLAFRKPADVEVPRWLSGKSYLDVTAQYLDTTDVTVHLDADILREHPGEDFAYICVFNTGEWKAIHWGEIGGDAVRFTEMGRNIAYLPALYVEEELLPAGPPFILTTEGKVRTLVADPDSPITVEMTATTPTTPDADTRADRPMIMVRLGGAYGLFVWRDGWCSLGERVAGDEPVSFESVPAGGLYWLVVEGSRRLERIFTIDRGRQVWW